MRRATASTKDGLGLKGEREWPKGDVPTHTLTVMFIKGVASVMHLSKKDVTATAFNKLIINILKHKHVLHISEKN